MAVEGETAPQLTQASCCSYDRETAGKHVVAVRARGGRGLGYRSSSDVEG